MLLSVSNSDCAFAMDKKPPQPTLPPSRPAPERPRVAAEPPLLTDVLDADDIPVLSEVVEPGMAPPPAERRRNDELRNAAEAVMQEVLAEYLPRLEVEMRRRLRARLASLIRAGKP